MWKLYIQLYSFVNVSEINYYDILAGFAFVNQYVLNFNTQLHKTEGYPEKARWRAYNIISFATETEKTLKSKNFPLGFLIL
jgi:hypothetical protein